MKASGPILLILATLFWAGNYVVGAETVASISPWSLVFWRWVIAAVPLLVLAQLLERPAWKKAWKHAGRLIVLSLSGLLGYNLLLYLALTMTTSTSASLINAFNPALILVFSAGFLGEKLTGRRIVGLGIGFVGVLLVLTKGTLGVAALQNFNLGDGLMVGAICMWTFYTIVSRGLTDVPPITATAIQALVVVLVLLPVNMVLGFRGPPTTASSLGLWYIALFPSVLSYALWNRAVPLVGAGRAGGFLNLITLFTVCINVLIGRLPTVVQIVGGFLILGGMVLSGRKSGPTRSPKNLR